MKRRLPALARGPVLTHFTRASRGHSAIDNLVSIMTDCIVRGARRMIRGDHRAVCMFDIPISELRSILVRENRRRYEPFGIAVDRRYAFKQGARPVIYLPWVEAKGIVAPQEHWRVVSMDIDRNPPIDWTHEREWRLRGDLALSPESCVALVSGWRDVDDIFERFNGRPPCAGVIPLRDLFGDRS